jgi:hypothetical protein
MQQSGKRFASFAENASYNIGMYIQPERVRPASTSCSVIELFAGDAELGGHAGSTPGQAET